MAIIKKDVIYDTVHQLKTDIYFPNDTNSKSKILLLWHGGGFFRGDKADLKKLGTKIANAGFVTFIPNYRLAPSSAFPKAHEDSEKFIKWLLASDYTDDDDQKDIVQIGISAGGTIALYLAGKFGFETVTWSAAVDFSKWLKEHETVKADKDLKVNAGIEQAQVNAAFYKYFVTCYGQSDDLQTYQKMDAINYDYQNLTELMMINSASELIPLSGVFDFAKNIALKGHDINLLVIKGKRHGHSYADEYLDESLDFLRQKNK